MSNKKASRVKGVKVFTRKQAEKALTTGADPELFVKHANYHVRAKAWKKMGSPLPENSEERSKLLASLHIKEKVEVVEVEPEMPQHPEVVAPKEEMSF